MPPVLAESWVVSRGLLLTSRNVGCFKPARKHIPGFRPLDAWRLYASDRTSLKTSRRLAQGALTVLTLRRKPLGSPLVKDTRLAHQAVQLWPASLQRPPRHPLQTRLAAAPPDTQPAPSSSADSPGNSAGRGAAQLGASGELRTENGSTQSPLQFQDSSGDATDASDDLGPAESLVIIQPNGTRRRFETADVPTTPQQQNQILSLLRKGTAAARVAVKGGRVAAGYAVQGGKAAAGYAVLGGKAAADYAVLGGRLAAKYAKQRGQTMSMDDADSQKADRSDLKSEDLVPVKLNHPALQLVRERAEQGSKPGQRTDAYKLGLVIEGGGMRGAVSGGALQALHDLGLKDAFDAVYGSSAGAINATYFLSDQRTGVDIYTEDIANQQFIDLGRLLNRNGDQGPVLNLKFLLDYVMEEVKPLDWEAVLRSPIPLKVVASSLDTLEPVMLDNFESKEDLRLCLKASANIPEIAGAPLVHRGQRLVDAAVFEAVPFRVAIADGCTHVITLCTRPPFKGGRLHKAFSDVITAAVKRAVLSPDYMKAAWQRELDMLAADGLSTDEMLLMSLDEGSEKLPFFAGTHVYPIFPGDAARYAPVCTDVETLKAGVAEGGKAVMRVFRPSEEQVQASERAVENPGSAAVALNEVKDHESDLRLSP